MRFVLELWPDESEGPLPPARLVKEAIDSIRDHGEELAWDVETDQGELIAGVTPEDLAKLERVLAWESGSSDEPGDQNASTQLVPHGYWSLGPTGDGRWGA